MAPVPSIGGGLSGPRRLCPPIVSPREKPRRRGSAADPGRKRRGTAGRGRARPALLFPGSAARAPAGSGRPEVGRSERWGPAAGAATSAGPGVSSSHPKVDLPRRGSSAAQALGPTLQMRRLRPLVINGGSSRAVSLVFQPLGARTCSVTSRLVSASAVIGAALSLLSREPERRRLWGPAWGSGGRAWAQVNNSGGRGGGAQAALLQLSTPSLVPGPASACGGGEAPSRQARARSRLPLTCCANGQVGKSFPLRVPASSGKLGQ